MKKLLFALLVTGAAICGLFLFQTKQQEDQLNFSPPPFPIANCVLNSSSTDSTWVVSTILDSMLSRKVVALGESTHGSKELFLWKIAVTQQLIQKGQFRSVGIETTFSEAESINNFVIGLTDGSDARNVLKDLRYPLLYNEEMARFLEWVRLYNSNHEEKVSVFGLDVPYSTRPQENVVNYLSSSIPALGKMAADAFSIILQKGVVDRFSDSQFLLTDAGVEMKVDSFKMKVIRNKHLLLRNSSEQEFNECLHNLDLISWAAGRVKLKNKPSEFLNFRDSTMAENVKWFTGKKSEPKTVVWAHNEHIREDVSKGRKAFGYYMTQWIGYEFYSTGADFGSGDFRYNTPDGIKIGTAKTPSPFYTALEPSMTGPACYIDFNNKICGNGGPKSQSTIHAIPANSPVAILETSALGQLFDAFFLVRNSHPTTSIQE